MAEVGTIAEILEVHPQPDGTYEVLTGGSSRFRIDRVLDTATPYLQAEVTLLDEVEGDAARAPARPDRRRWPPSTGA